MRAVDKFSARIKAAKPAVKNHNNPESLIQSLFCSLTFAQDKCSEDNHSQLCKFRWLKLNTKQLNPTRCVVDADTNEWRQY